ncbi:transcription initiation factor IIB family protein [Haladaptatus sp. GCM10025707]|uniref:transcription initiation factor IIB n=1 Tax=unclassified Haladaptatus TaxID=2622732 RepID=UPI0023E7B04F|nr:TFIIB-type zinc ribbon-containing protein [Haladaptatus sp. QDMS2]
MTRTKLSRREAPSSERTATTDARAKTQCPECNGRIVQDGGRGESTCEDCGLVVDEDDLDHGPEWRAYTAGERDDKSRVGAPTTQLIHDKGLSSTISWQDKDAYGKPVSERKRSRLKRLRTWDERYRTKDSHERNLRQALGEISRMASALGLGEPIRETAGVIYRRALSENLLPGRSIEGMATASLYAAARQQGVPRPLSEFTEVSRVDETRIQRAYRYLSRELALEIEPENPAQYLPQFASALEVDDEVERQARELLSVSKGTGAHVGKSPVGLAAAALYAATQLTNRKVTQERVGDVARVSVVTIRNRYQDLLTEYETQRDV